MFLCVIQASLHRNVTCLDFLDIFPISWLSFPFTLFHFYCKISTVFRSVRQCHQGYLVVGLTCPVAVVNLLLRPFYEMMLTAHLLLLRVIRVRCPLYVFSYCRLAGTCLFLVFSLGILFFYIPVQAYLCRTFHNFVCQYLVS